MVSTETFELWRDRLDSYTQSKLKPREWCEQQDITLHQFYYWRQRFNKLAHAEASDHQWLTVDFNEPNPATSAPVKYASPISIPSTFTASTYAPSTYTPSTYAPSTYAPSTFIPSGLNIHIAGAVIALQHGFDPALLQAAVQALRALPC